METHLNEVLTLQFMSYAAIPFRAEIYADELLIDWDDDRQGFFTGQTYYQISHHFASEGMRQIRIVGKNISHLNVSRQNLLGIELEDCPALDYLDCSVNELPALNLEHCPSLEELHCNSNNIRMLDFSANPRLFLLEASYNNLETLYLRACNELRALHCSNNCLSDLEMEGCDHLSHLDISANCLETSELVGIFQQLSVKDKKSKAIIHYHANPGDTVGCDDILKSKNWH